VREGKTGGDLAHFSLIILVKDTARQHVSMNIAEKKEAVRRNISGSQDRRTVRAARFRPAHVPAHYISCTLGAHAGDQSSSVGGSHAENDPGCEICTPCVE
jgi:hypothetical protein